MNIFSQMEAAWFPSPFSRCGTQGWCDLKSLWEGCDPDGPQVLRRAVLYSNLSSCTLRCRSPNERTSLWASLVKGVVRFQSQQVLCLRTVNCVLQRCAILPLSSGFSHTHTHTLPPNRDMGWGCLHESLTEEGQSIYMVSAIPRVGAPG